ncbi:NUDIX hydrolase [Candidatus Saccharibacteria bacterium]|nr:NUDIX hydrolase [Candidatus Saccharibacteria bacterium]
MTKEEFEASIAWSRVVAACVIRDDKGRYLLVQEAQPKVYGLWNLAAGHVDKGESIEEAAVREAKEETGLDVKLVDKIGIWHDKVDEPIRHAFTVRIVGGEVTPQPGEVLDVQLFTYDQIVQMRKEGKLRVEWIFDAISRVQSP